MYLPCHLCRIRKSHFNITRVYAKRINWYISNFEDFSVSEYIRAHTHAHTYTLDEQKITVSVNKNSKRFHDTGVLRPCKKKKKKKKAARPGTLPNDSTSIDSCERERAGRTALFKRGRVMEGANVLACTCHFKCFRKVLMTFNFLATASRRRRWDRPMPLSASEISVPLQKLSLGAARDNRACPAAASGNRERNRERDAIAGASPSAWCLIGNPAKCAEFRKVPTVIGKREAFPSK